MRRVQLVSNFVINMLTNFPSMTAEKIHNTLKFFMTDPVRARRTTPCCCDLTDRVPCARTVQPYEGTLVQLKRLLARLVGADRIAQAAGGQYVLKR